MKNQNSKSDPDLGVWTAGTQAAVESARAADALLVSRLEALIGKDSAHEAMVSGVLFKFAARMTRSCLEDAPSRNQLALDLREALRDHSNSIQYAIIPATNTLIDARDSYREIASSISITIPDAGVQQWLVKPRGELVCV